MPIARAMLIACLNVLAWLSVVVAVLLLLLAGLQLLRPEAGVRPLDTALAALVAMAGAALCRWAAGRVEAIG